MKLVISENAKEDLAEMLRYGTWHWGRERALQFLDTFIEELEILIRYPEMGARDRKYRELPSDNYRTVYTIKDQTIVVIGIEPKGRTRR